MDTETDRVWQEIAGVLTCHAVQEYETWRARETAERASREGVRRFADADVATRCREIAETVRRGTL